MCNLGIRVRVCPPTDESSSSFGKDMYLHLYHNDADDKEHLAMVFGNTIVFTRKASLGRRRGLSAATAVIKSTKPPT